MISFHIQNSPNDWPEAVAKLPAKAPVKMVFGVERCAEAKAANPKCLTWYRWVGGQPLPSSNFEAHARSWLNQFIDGTFRREAKNVDLIGEYNETLANSQGAEERARWLALHTAMAKVWATEYRKEPELKHIRMTLCATAVGNDIGLDFARVAVQYDALLDYHPYIVVSLNVPKNARALFEKFDFPVRFDAPRASFHGGILYEEDVKPYVMQQTQDTAHAALSTYQMVVNRPDFVSPHDWEWYSGRWAKMDAVFAAAGMRPDWIFGEMGAVRDASNDWSGHLDPQGGWRHPGALNADINKYIEVLRYWLDNATRTVAYREGRLYGGVVFTSGGPGSLWQYFELAQPHMNAVADLSRTFSYPPIVTPLPNNPLDVLWDLSIGKQAISLNPGASIQGAIFKDNYVPVQSEFRATVDGVAYAVQAGESLKTGDRQMYYTDVPNWNDVRKYRPNNGAIEDVQIIDIVDDLPKHPTKTYLNRPLDAITTLTIHHTVSPPDRSIASIAAYHVSSNGWPGIGYHFVINDKGVIYQTNHLTTKSYHAGTLNAPGDENLISVGIALQGDFTSSQPLQAQLDAAAWLVMKLRGMLSTVTMVKGHKEMPGAATACPGATWPNWKGYVLGA